MKTQPQADNHIIWWNNLKSEDRFNFSIQMYGKAKTDNESEIQKIYNEYVREKKEKEINSRLKEIDVVSWWKDTLTDKSRTVLTQIFFGVDKKIPTKRSELNEMYNTLVLNGMLR